MLGPRADLGAPAGGHDVPVAGAGVAAGVVAHAEVVADLVRHHEHGGEAGAGVGLAAGVPHTHLPDDAAVPLGADLTHDTTLGHCSRPCDGVTPVTVARPMVR